MSVGPLDVGYLATTAIDGLSSPSAAAYAEFPESCETLGRLTVVQNLPVPVAASFMTILPGAGLGPSTLWMASTRQLLRWTLAVPAEWSISAPSAAPEATCHGVESGCLAV
eukprot:Skav236567  [mRNA]  locus=scaffold2180:30720:32219:+ [translate_table: standard]